MDNGRLSVVSQDHQGGSFRAILQGQPLTAEVGSRKPASPLFFKLPTADFLHLTHHKLQASFTESDFIAAVKLVGLSWNQAHLIVDECAI